MNVRQQIVALNRFLRGWINYFRIANCKTLLQKLMSWIRRRLRMKQMREWKSWKALHRQLRRNGYRGEFLKISMRRWRNSASPLLSMALPNSWFEQMGLVDLCKYECGVLFRYYEK
ncbi:MAG: group II intron maturase-specific domain-containing protein [Limnochordia bacterium]